MKQNHLKMQKIIKIQIKLSYNKRFADVINLSKYIKD